jgi:large subunit ribosomal protein L25
MSRPQLSARPRDVRGKAVAHLRRSGVLPAVVYGAGSVGNISIDVTSSAAPRRAGRHAVIDLSIEGDGKAQPVLLQAIQEHPVSRNPLHVDLLVVNLEEERTVDARSCSSAVELSPMLGGVLLHLRDAVLVRAKPDDLPSGIELDISSLVDFELTLHASDLIMPAGVALVTDLDEALARVQQPRIEEEPVVAEAEAAAPEEGAEGGRRAEARCG